MQEKLSEEEIINILEKYVKDKFKDDYTGHDFWHLERVYKTSQLINKKENADEFIIKMIVLMHNLYDHKFYNGNVETKLEETLRKLNIYDSIPKESIENIIYSSANLGFSSNYDNKKELSIEGKIVQDADRLDAIGAIGIARTFAYGAIAEKLIYDPNNNESVSKEVYKTKGSNTSISHFYDKLLKVRDRMNTETAKEIANERHKFLEKFLREFLDEWDGKK